MASVEFIYNGSPTLIQCQKEDKMEDIIDKFLAKCQKNKGTIFFLYSGKTLDEDLTFNEAANKLDKSNNIMRILAWDILLETDNSASKKKAKYIICPKCYANARINIDENYKIYLYECVDGHKTENIHFDEFEASQLIDQTKIKCDHCKIENKGNTYQNSFYKCCTCKLNLCPKCKNIHDKNHSVIDYEDKDFYCYNHYKTFESYCTDCKRDLCKLCQKDHINHKTISFESFISKIDEGKKELINLKETIRNLRKYIKGIIAKLNYVIDNINNYYNIYNNIIYNLDIKKINYLQLQNLNDLKAYNNNFMRNITEINIDENIKFKFFDLINLYNKMAFAKNEEEEKEEENQNEIIDNNESIEDELEEENYSKNIIRFNPSDNKYENFDIKNIKEIKKLETKNEIKNLLVLHDRRLLTIQEQDNYEKGNAVLNKVCVYDLTSSFICDINFDIKANIIDIYQMPDDYIIFFPGLISVSYATIGKIKKNSIINIFECDIYCTKHSDNFIDDMLVSSKINKVNNLFFIERLGGFDVYSYKEGKIEKDFYFDINDITFFNLCESSEKEIAIYHKKKGKIYGQNAYIKFYDIKDNKKIKTLKLGDHKSGEKLLFIDKNNLAVEFNNKILLIDPIKKTIRNELKHIDDKVFRNMCLLNGKTFLVSSYSGLYQYELNKNKIIYKNKKEIKESDIIKKYPDEQLVIFIHSKQIIIFGTESK